MFCNSVCADRTVMAASRFLAAAGVYVIRLSFAAGHRKSHWSGCIKVARVILSVDLFNFAGDDFPFKVSFEKRFHIVLFSHWRRDPVLELHFLAPLRVVLLCFAPRSVQIAL